MITIMIKIYNYDYDLFARERSSSLIWILSSVIAAGVMAWVSGFEG